MNHLEKIAGYSRSVTDRKRCDGNKRPWKPNARLKRYVKTSVGRKSASRFLISITGKCSILFVTAIGVSSSKLPDHPGTTLALLRNGCMERRSTGEGAEYRMTEAGLLELSRPR
ncbi:hypothetical protein IVB27_08780 [Bradyrhizobium sp. 197]|uniref:hypothetical protein n=1 Tax=Bradyrhizobium sp. 197 TaxID=2782663 RepID=UPI001FF8CE88|nr:hypothetical protein [Bradyrhizobium sp. 197]MCK1474900.1 hypothetical protein [Bradyrhizobium sp. 197]